MKCLNFTVGSKTYHACIYPSRPQAFAVITRENYRNTVDIPKPMAADEKLTLIYLRAYVAEHTE